MLNIVALVGRLTKDCEVRKTQSGLSTCSFAVACKRRGEGTDFINCVAWRQSADFLGQYAKKGNVIAVSGHIQTRNYDDKDGKKVYVTEVVADSVKLAGSNKGTEEHEASQDEYSVTEEEYGDNLPF